MITAMSDSTRRLRIVKPAIPDSAKVMRTPFDIAVRAMNEYLTPTTKADIERDFARSLRKSQFPVMDLNRLVDYFGAVCLPQLPATEVQRLFGWNWLLQYKQSLVNQAMYVALRHASIEWIIMGLPRNFAMTYNFGVYEAHQLEAKHWRLTFEDYPLYPHIKQGFLQAGAAELGNDTQYTVTVLNPKSAWIDITWSVGKLT